MKIFLKNRLKLTKEDDTSYKYILWFENRVTQGYSYQIYLDELPDNNQDFTIESQLDEIRRNGLILREPNEKYRVELEELHPKLQELFNAFEVSLVLGIK